MCRDPGRARRILAVLSFCLWSSPMPGLAEVDPSAIAALRWRPIGPFRAGRVSAGALDPSEPNTYYFGTPGGGVWKSTNAGQTWTPIFDRTGMASIGALAVAPSQPKVIYAGSGEESRGDGVYKSTNGGATWTNVGLRETHFIGSLVINPDNPDVVLAGAIGDRTSGPDRGVFRTTDGGSTWTKVLFVDARAGCPSVVAAPDAPQIVLATMYPAAGARGAALVAPVNPAATERGRPARHQPHARPVQAGAVRGHPGSFDA